MERLYDAAVNLGFDLVVLDTPPARNALDILDAPRQLASFLDARIVGWFLPNTQGRGLAERLLARGGEMAKRLLGMVTGETLLDELLEFLSAFSDLREGFAKRAQYIDDLLRAPSTAFILVSSASPASADDAAWLREDLDRRKVPVDAVVFNQSYQVLDPTRPREAIESVRTSDIEAHVARLAPHLQGTTGVRDLLVAMRQLRVDAGQDNARCQRVVAGLSAELPPGCPRIHVPRLGDEIRDLDGLARLVEFLLPPVPPV
jgi:anion-transporting  ArsA/GET3 family ATPase